MTDLHLLLRELLNTIYTQEQQLEALQATQHSPQAKTTTPQPKRRKTRPHAFTEPQLLHPNLPAYPINDDGTPADQNLFDEPFPPINAPERKPSKPSDVFSVRQKLKQAGTEVKNQ